MNSWIEISMAFSNTIRPRHVALNIYIAYVRMTYIWTRYSTYQLKGIQIFLALIFYSEEIFCWNFQVKILRRVNFVGENFITYTILNDEISSFFQNFQFLKMTFFLSWEQIFWNRVFYIVRYEDPTLILENVELYYIYHMQKTEWKISSQTKVTAYELLGDLHYKWA